MQNERLSKVICLMGPTGSGKTQLAIDLCKIFPFEIISVDSAMIYREMDIGTAKPRPAILKIAPHRLINLRDPKDTYSAADFRQDAIKEIKRILSENKIPLLVGGTMLYFRALQKGLAPMPSKDPMLREKLQKEGEQKGWEAMHKKLAAFDPDAARRIHPNDPQRIQRALEVYLLTDKSITHWQEISQASQDEWEYINIAISPTERSLLHQRIAARFDEMLKQGLVDEVKKLFARDDLSKDTPALRSVGYRQVYDYLLGQMSYEDMREKAIIATRQLAKRQLTWLRSWPDLHWFDSEDPELLKKVISFLVDYDAKNASNPPYLFKE